MDDMTLPPGTPPHLRSAAQRYRCLLARGLDRPAALCDLVAYLVVLRPGLPRVLAQEQAETVAAWADPGAPRAAAAPPRRLLVALAAAERPDDS
jgi:hypothetical protein